MAVVTKKVNGKKVNAKVPVAYIKLMEKKAAAKKPTPKKVVKKIEPKKPELQKINRVAFLLDASVSMSHIVGAVKAQFAQLISGIRASTPKDQNVEISLFTFSMPGFLRTLCLNQNIDSVDEHNITQIYSATGGSTALVQSTLETINVLKGAFTDWPRDITNLLYVITDGQDNSSSRQSINNIHQVLGTLGDRWSVAVLVPTFHDRLAAIQYGFPAGNIEVWDASSAQGVETATRSVAQSYSNYSAARTQGITCSSNLFHVDASNLTNKDVKDNLSEFNGRIFPVRVDSRIDEFVSKATGKPYVKGSAYYELSKYEKKVQGYKKIAIRSKTTDKTYGGAEARKMLGLGHGDVAVSSDIVNGNWRVFVQSTSDNRKLIAGTSVLVEA